MKTPLRTLAVTAALSVTALPALAGILGQPLGLEAPVLGLTDSPTLGAPLAIPVLAFAGGIALVTGVRFIKKRRS